MSYDIPFEHGQVEQDLLMSEQIHDLIKFVGAKITRDFQGKEAPIMMCVLNGGCVFFADLIREINLPVEIDFIRASSYGSGTTSSGQVRLTCLPRIPVENRHVILVEDIVDTGITLHYLKNFLEGLGATVDICALLHKTTRTEIEVPVRYKCFTLDNDAFVVGFGMDYAGKYRNLPYVCVLKPEVYSSGT